ncbi:LysE family translocator [Marinobacterium marinum]|uniref:LysE family translocator n=1 Tax=Marinobacterium marinum TaxID=2756129 RepID=A0A7W1WXS1_9GAMM|nr:LysE family translocator [Marinobacterium marinum]MBA4502190.1 LysE family translocator [Marinobacterium marinum]
MTISLIAPMAVFALAASISPGPVNLVCLSSGIRYPLGRGMVFVTGATLGFIVLFVTVGLGLYSAMAALPWLESALRWGGVIFLLYLSMQLFRDNGQLTETKSAYAPGFMAGAAMQWLNPKAWLASASGIGAYTDGSDLQQVALFASLYLPICWASLSCWVCAGAFMRRYIQRPGLIVLLNRIMALLLASSSVLMLI